MSLPLYRSQEVTRHYTRSWQPEPIAGSAGATTVRTPKDVLHARGPLLAVTAALPPEIEEALIKNGQLVPAPKAGMGLIDTGATGSAIDETVARELGLPVIDRITVMTPSDVSHQCNRYPVRVSVPGSTWQVDLICTGSEIGAQGLLLLLGRDMLRDAQFVYNGEFGFFTISY